MDAEAGAAAAKSHVSTPSRGRKRPRRCFGASQESPIAFSKTMRLHMLHIEQLMSEQKESGKEKPCREDTIP